MTPNPTDRAMPRVAACCRYSSEMQNPRSIDDQVKVIQRYCERQGWPPVPDTAIFADREISGSGTAHRTEYQRLLGAIATSNGRPPYDLILLEDFSRLSRDMIEMSRLQRMAPIWGLSIVDVSTGRDISDDSSLYDGIRNQQFLKDHKRRIRRGLAGRFQDHYHSGGRMYGYRSLPVPHPSGRTDTWGRPLLLGRTLEVHEEEAAIVRRIFAEAAAGVSPRTIAGGLDRDGIPKPSVRYRLVKAKAVSWRETPWQSQTVRSILTNPRYKGEWKYLKTVGVGTHPDTEKTIRRAAPSETLTDHREHLRLVTDKVWNTVQDILETRAAAVKQDPVTGRLQGREKGSHVGTVFGRVPTAVTGLVTCSECGGPFNVLKNWTDPQGVRVRYLGCLHAHHYQGHCKNIGLARLDAIEGTIQTALGGYFSNSQLVEAHTKRFFERLGELQQEATAEECRARGDLDAAEKERENIRAAIAKGFLGNLTTEMLTAAEKKREEALKALAKVTETRQAAPKMLPPVEILKQLRAQRIGERREAYRKLLTVVRLRSTKPPGKRKVVKWTMEIVPRPEAGLTGIPQCLNFGGHS